MTAPSPARRLSLDLPAVHDQVTVARRSVRIFARLQGLSGRELDHLLLVVSELLSNVVDHGGGDSAMDLHELTREARMGLTLEIAEERWILEVVDHGGGDAHAIRALLHGQQSPGIEDERGRGLYLLKAMVDEIDVFPSTDGRGLRFKAVLRFHGRARPGAAG